MTIEAEVARFLRSSRLSRINLQYGSCRVWGEGYRRVADSIERRVSSGHYISVTHNRAFELLNCGSYNESVGPNRVNVMRLPFRSMSLPRDFAIALHESTHALQDWARQPLRQADSEGAAYVAQMLYLMIDCYDDLPDFMRGNQGTPLFERSWEVARRIYTTPGAYRVTDAEKEAITEQLVRISVYRAARTRVIHYDGL